MDRCQKKFCSVCHEQILNRSGLNFVHSTRVWCVVMEAFHASSLDTFQDKCNAIWDVEILKRVRRLLQLDTFQSGHVSKLSLYSMTRRYFDSCQEEFWTMGHLPQAHFCTVPHVSPEILYIEAWVTWGFVQYHTCQFELLSRKGLYSVTGVSVKWVQFETFQRKFTTGWQVSNDGLYIWHGSK